MVVGWSSEVPVSLPAISQGHSQLPQVPMFLLTRPLASSKPTKAHPVFLMLLV